ncbi:hypothetical protein BCR34DRAFT_574520 [Clohesyomyces aquaticus]|uniref:Uncharacterized protein n=1 Tax=Clohesyomyces aquaticus TaxID=1231657 RepID=A0A1Y1YVM1_9PLEO|nr:hypothetical protein BCR34DRAFT_574520 [Clohesyomyces aquaticus]
MISSVHRNLLSRPILLNHAKMMLLLTILLFIPLLARAEDSWDNFANNLATDLAPILQLFGEQITKQYLSESTSVLDNIIFAMAPMGVLTAIVSVIRVCGGPRLRAFIGRAQEGPGIAEMELCSSTGRDVSEIYQNGAITRIIGRPKLLEIVCYPAETKDLYGYDDPNLPGHAGIHTFQAFQRTETGRKEWIEEITGRSKAKQNGGGSVLRNDDEENANAELETAELARSPNLMLNIGFKRLPRMVMCLIAVAGICLQLGVLVFAGVITGYRKIKKNESAPRLWLLEVSVLGTVMLCMGMFGCSFLIEQSTKERKYRRSKDNSKSTLYWIQPGGQVAGDQTMESFIHSDSLSLNSLYVSSWRTKNPREGLLTLFTITITTVGFVLQFIGLRGLHASVSVFQISAVLIMSTLRAALRTQRLQEGVNWKAQLPSPSSNRHHELDWLSLHLAMAGSIEKHQWSTKSSLTSWVLLRPEPAAMIIGASAMPAGGETNHPEISDSNGGSCSPLGVTPAELEQDGHWTPRLGARVWHYRCRLSQLTDNRHTPTSPQQAWPDSLVEGRTAARQLWSTIAAMTKVIFPDTHHWVQSPDVMQIPFRFILNGYITAKVCAQSASVGTAEVNPKGETTEQGLISFVLHREFEPDGYPTGRWTPNFAQLEAAIGLSLFSLRSQHTTNSQDSKDSPELGQSSPYRRVVLVDEYASAREAKELRLWSEEEIENLGLISAEIESTLGDEHMSNCLPGSLALWIRDTHPTIFKQVHCEGAPEEAVRFFGWDSNSLKRLGEGDRFPFFYKMTDASLEQLLAQDILKAFLEVMFSHCSGVEGSPLMVHDLPEYDRRHAILDALIAVFVSFGLGSREDACVCIMPTAISSHYISPARDTISKSAKRDLRLEIEGHYTLAQQGWTKSLSIASEFGLRKEFRDCSFRLGSLCIHAMQSDSFQDLYVAYEGICEMLYRRDERCAGPEHTELAIRLAKMYLSLSGRRSWTASIAQASRLPDVPDKCKDAGTFRWDDLISAVQNDEPIKAFILSGMCGHLYRRRREQPTQQLEPKTGGRNLMSLLACRSGQLWYRIREEMLQLRCDIHSTDDDGRNAISWACERGDVQTVIQLLVAGAVLSYHDKFDRTPIDYAIMNYRVDVLEYIIRGPMKQDRDHLVIALGRFCDSMFRETSNVDMDKFGAMIKRLSSVHGFALQDTAVNEFILKHMPDIHANSECQAGLLTALQDNSDPTRDSRAANFNREFFPQNRLIRLKKLPSLAALKTAHDLRERLASAVASGKILTVREELQLAIVTGKSLTVKLLLRPGMPVEKDLLILAVLRSKRALQVLLEHHNCVSDDYDIFAYATLMNGPECLNLVLGSEHHSLLALILREITSCHALLLEHLIRSQIDVRDAFKENSLLVIAIAAIIGNIETLEMLTKNGISFPSDFSDSEAEVVIGHAVEGGHLNAAKFLVDQINGDRMDLLHRLVTRATMVEPRWSYFRITNLMLKRQEMLRAAMSPSPTTAEMAEGVRKWGTKFFRELPGATNAISNSRHS